MTVASPTGGMSLLTQGSYISINDGADFSRLLSRSHISAGGGGVTLGEKYAIRAGASTIDVTASRLLGGPAIAVAVAGAAGVAVGDAINIAMGNETSGLVPNAFPCVLAGQAWNCRETAAPSASGGTVTGYCAPHYGGGCAATPQAACETITNQPGWEGWVVVAITTTTPMQCQFTAPNGSNGGSVGISRGGTFPGTTSTCPASIDAFNPAWSVPAGSPPDAGGKCRTGRYNQGNALATTAAIAAAAEAYLAANPAKAPEVVQSIHAQGVPIPGAGPRELSGPASSTAAGPSTTTTTTGQPTTTTTGSTTNNYTYQGNRVSYSTTVTNNTTNNTTTTTTTTVAPPAPADEKDPCEGNPDRLGCVKLGEGVAQKPLYTKKTKTFGDVLGGFRTTMAASPMGSALGGFFDVTLSGTCPVWVLNVPYINASATIDAFCLPWVTSMLGVFAVVVNIVAAFMAFRVAIL